MSTTGPTPDQSTPDASPAAPPLSASHGSSKSQRVLSCVLCQQRKVKCDRSFPCSNCVKSKATCVPATLGVRRRRRKFHERELLERIRKYEDMLRQAGTKFEPLPPGPPSEKDSTIAEGGDHSDDDMEAPESMATDDPAPSVIHRMDKPADAKNFWNVISQAYRDPGHDSDSSNDPVQEIAIVKALDQVFSNNDHLIFGSRKSSVDLSTFHPSAVHILRLWQTYLENVNPILKVTHPPSLQGRIIEAAGHVASIGRSLEALMFGIYCMSVLSLSEDECTTLFNQPKEELMTKYQFGCQQALLNCGFLRTSDCDCLTALFLYLISIRSSTDPRSLSPLLGMAIRIAQRLGIHSESYRGGCTVLEAEVRRRLWWSLILYDTRISEMADAKSSSLALNWDCMIPLNVNDSDLQPEMREPPAAQKTPTDAIFAVVRSEIGQFLRHTAFHRNYVNPVFTEFAKDVPKGLAPKAREFSAFEKMIEDKYLKLCDPAIPLHFMTIWVTRGQLAKYRLIEHCSQVADPSLLQTDAHRDVILRYALAWIQCDTNIMTSPLSKGFHWFIHTFYPFPAYVQVALDLRRRPTGKDADRAWQVLGDNFVTRLPLAELDDNPFLKILWRMVLQAWDAREAASREQGGDAPPLPKLVAFVRSRVNRSSSSSSSSQGPASAGTPDSLMGMTLDDLQTTMISGLNHAGIPVGTAMLDPQQQQQQQQQFAAFSAGAGGNPMMTTAHPSLGLGMGGGSGMNPFHWGPVNWGLMNPWPVTNAYQPEATTAAAGTSTPSKPEESLDGRDQWAFQWMARTK